MFQSLKLFQTLGSMDFHAAITNLTCWVSLLISKPRDKQIMVHVMGPIWLLLALVITIITTKSTTFKWVRTGHVILGICYVRRTSYSGPANQQGHSLYSISYFNNFPTTTSFTSILVIRWLTQILCTMLTS